MEIRNEGDAFELLDDIIRNLEGFDTVDQIATLRGFVDTIQEKLTELEELKKIDLEEGDYEDDTPWHMK